MRKRKCSDFSKDVSLKEIDKLVNLNESKLDNRFARKGWSELSCAFQSVPPQSCFITSEHVPSTSVCVVQDCSSPLNGGHEDFQTGIESPVCSQDEIAIIDDFFEGSTTQCSNHSPVFSKPCEISDTVDTHDTLTDDDIESLGWSELSCAFQSVPPQSCFITSEHVPSTSVCVVQDCSSPLNGGGEDFQTGIESPVRSQDEINSIDDFFESSTTQCSSHSPVFSKPCEISDTVDTHDALTDDDIESLVSRNSSAIQCESILDVQSLSSTASIAPEENGESEEASMFSDWISPEKSLGRQMKGSEWLKMMASMMVVPGMPKMKAVDHSEISREVKKFNTVKGGFAEQLKKVLSSEILEATTHYSEPLKVAITNFIVGNVMLIADASLLPSTLSSSSSSSSSGIQVDMLLGETLGLILENRVAHAWMIREGSVLHIKPSWQMLTVPTINKSFILCPHVVDVNPPECKKSD